MKMGCRMQALGVKLDETISSQLRGGKMPCHGLFRARALKPFRAKGRSIEIQKEVLSRIGFNDTLMLNDSAQVCKDVQVK